MQRMLNDWYAKMGQLIQEFEDKYEHAADEQVMTSESTS
jgi:predicted transcriptional regulator